MSNIIQYFKRLNGTGWVAVAPGFYQESVQFWEINQLVSARIEFHKTDAYTANFYECNTDTYSPCSKEEYLAARYQAQVATAEFFGEFQQFQASLIPTKPNLMQGFVAQVRQAASTVILATGLEIINDLPF